MTNNCKWWLGTLLTIYFSSIAGMYMYLKDANSQQIENLRSELNLANREKLSAKSNLDNILSECNNNHESPKSVENLDENELRIRLSQLEKERDLLIEKTLSRSTTSVDPRSEIATHLQMLKSEFEADQTKALDFLFAIKDPVTLKPLKQFFIITNSGKEPHIKSAYEWYELFLELDQKVGIEFVINELNNPNPSNSNAAFSTLKRELDDTFMYEKLKPGLTSLALTSGNATARGYAKVLLDIISGNRLD